MKDFWFFANYTDYEPLLARAMLTFAMLGMGATLKVSDFATVFKVPKGFIVGMILQVIIIPIVAFLLIQFAAVPMGLVGCGVGMALVAAMPGGSASNIFTHMGRGNAALSVALTAGATLTCLVTTPVVFKLIAPAVDFDLEMPYRDVIQEIALFLLLPLVVGMGVNRFAPKFALPFSKWNVRLSLIMVAVIIVGAVGAGRVDFDTFGWKGILLVIGFSVAAQQVSLWTTVAFRFPPPDRLAIIVEVTIRNTLLALALYTLLPSSEESEAVKAGAFFVILFYGGAAMLVALPPLLHYRKLADAAAAEGEAPSEPENA